MGQLTSLRSISTAIDAGTDPNAIISMIIDSIQTTIGMDRVVFALLSPNKKYLRAKTAVGHKADCMLKEFKFELTEDRRNIFLNIVENQKPLWVSERSSQEIKELIPERIANVIGNGPFYASPIVVDGKTIGLFFSDRMLSERDLDADCFQAFKQFTQQASISLELLGKG